MTTQDDFFNPLVEKLNREVLRYAVSRKMFCECGKILDVRRAVLVTNASGTTGVSCGDCFDASLVRMATELGLESLTAGEYLRDHGGEISDGRRKKKAGVLVPTAPPDRQPECEGQTSLEVE